MGEDHFGAGLGSGVSPDADQFLVWTEQGVGAFDVCWGEAGSDALAHLRALYCSDDEQWDAFWAFAE